VTDGPTPQTGRGAAAFGGWASAGARNKEKKMKLTWRHLAALAGCGFLLPARAYAFGETAWTPLIQSTDFTGVKTDLLTGANGLVLLFLIIFGVSMLLRVFK
jgi:hypothetical protein